MSYNDVASGRVPCKELFHQEDHLVSQILYSSDKKSFKRILAAAAVDELCNLF